MCEISQHKRQAFLFVAPNNTQHPVVLSLILTKDASNPQLQRRQSESEGIERVQERRFISNPTPYYAIATAHQHNARKTVES